MHDEYQAVVEATRGEVVESVHFGALTIVDSDGKLLASYGDPMAVSCLRSSSKPLQILQFVEDGGVEKYGITEKELSVMCASHSGTDDHAETVASIQRKIGASESDLLCGTHYPIDKATTERMRKLDQVPTPNQHNCSGKHSGMLANAKLHGFDIQEYIREDHPLQKMILKTFAEMCGVEVDEVKLGIDGCSVPVFAIPMYNTALGFARLANPEHLSEKRAIACRKITHAMMTHPFMVAGPNRFDTALMEAAGGRIFCKGGAEGYQGIGILPGTLPGQEKGIGISIKISDGDNGGRARPVIAMKLFRELGLVDDAFYASMAGYDRRPIYNWRHFEVGELRPCFELNYA